MYINIKIFQMMSSVASFVMPNVGLWHKADLISYSLTKEGKKTCSIFTDDRGDILCKQDCTNSTTIDIKNHNILYTLYKIIRNFRKEIDPK